MNTNLQLQALQNFANNYNLDAVVCNFEDKRKKQKFVLKKGKNEVSPKLSYDEMNIFLLGILNCKKHEL